MTIIINNQTVNYASPVAIAIAGDSATVGNLVVNGVNKHYDIETFDGDASITLDLKESRVSLKVNRGEVVVNGGAGRFKAEGEDMTVCGNFGKK